MKFSIKDFFSQCDQIRNILRIWSHLRKKSLMENFIFCVMQQYSWKSYLYELQKRIIWQKTFTQKLPRIYQVNRQCYSHVLFERWLLQLTNSIKTQWFLGYMNTV